MIKSFLTIIVLVLTFCDPLSAQRETVNQSIEWFTVSSLFKVSKHYSILGEGQFRFANDLQPMQFQARTALDIIVSKQFSFMPLGYAYTWNPIYGKQPASFANNEHRIFQQVQYTHKIGILNFGHRARLEQRFVEVHSISNGEIVSEGYTLYLNRLRYRFQLQIPINNREIVAGTFYASFYDEVFMDFGSNVVYTDPDQNRLFVGAGYKINKDGALQVGFFEQTLIKLTGAKQENNVGFQVVLLYNFDLTRKVE